MKKCILIVLVVINISIFCSCTTTYQRSSFTGGYSDMQLSIDQYQVSFSGNAYIGANDAYLFFLTRCAEIAKNKGYKYFYITSLQNTSGTYSYTTPGQINTQSYSNFSGNYRSTGYGSGRIIGTVNTTSYSTYTPPITYNYNKPSFTGTILLVNNAIDQKVYPFDAQILYRQGKSRSENIEITNYTLWGIGGGIVLISFIASLL